MSYPRKVPDPWIECVPNFSEGANEEILAAIDAAIQSSNGSLLLGRESDTDHNRSVFTIAGPPDAVVEAAVRAATVAAARINLTRHRGVHPRIGAADVIPFIPLEGATLEDCAALARTAAHEIWRRAGVPSYLYEFAATRSDRAQLESIRKVGFEALSVRALSDPAWTPDVGGPALHPTAGASAVGARRILIACNVNLATDEIKIAKAIATAIRTSSGGFRYVKALGLALPSKGLTQVSINLTHYEVTALATVFDRIRTMARVHSTEIIGFPPIAALAGAEDFLALCDRWHAGRILENRIAELTRL